MSGSAANRAASARTPSGPTGSELAFVAVNVVTALSLHRVFVGGGWVVPLLAQVVVGHVGMALLRRRGVGPVVAAAVGAGLALTALVWIHAGHLSAFGIPTLPAIEHLGSLVGDAFGTLEEAKAPVVAADGFVIMAAAGLWLSVVGGDAAAFRAGTALEALAPATTVFVVVSVFAGDAHRVTYTTLWLAAVLVFVVVDRSERIVEATPWVARGEDRGPAALYRLGGTLAVVALVGAVVVVPRLPGAGAEAMIDLTDLRDDGGSRVTLSPFVDIRGRLVDQSATEVFTVRSDARAYWRLTSLDRFDGNLWSSSGSYAVASGALPRGSTASVPEVTATQEYTVEGLAQIWLPAAYEPRRVEAPGTVRYDDVSGTLIVDADQATSDGLTYTVESAIPEHDPARLAAAATTIPGEISRRYMSVPGDFPSEVRALAREITEGAESRFEAALALQDHFRANFDYDLSVRAGHDGEAMTEFLFDLRRGYCEQFAGTYAAMLRSIGIPARVAVGFTPGEPDPDDPSLYRVRGEHAHAWPEVYLGEYGWVAFEPTPGRGSPQGQSYTGVPEQQASAGDPTTATTVAVSDLGTDPLADPTLDPLTGLPTELEEYLDQVTGGAAPAPAPASDAGWTAPVAAVGTALAVAAAAYAAFVLSVPAFTRRRRRAGARTVVEQVALAWDETVRSLARTGLEVPPFRGQTRLAGQIAVARPSIGTPVRELAQAVERVTYGPSEPPAEVGRRALATADQIDERLRHDLSLAERLSRALDPRRFRP